MMNLHSDNPSNPRPHPPDDPYPKTLFTVHLSIRYVTKAIQLSQYARKVHAEGDEEAAQFAAKQSLTFSLYSIHCLSFGVPSLDFPIMRIWADLVAHNIAPRPDLVPSDLVGPGTPAVLPEVLEQADELVAEARNGLRALKEMISEVTEDIT